MELLQSAAEKLGIYLTSFHFNQFEVYYRELTIWNKRINLTRITTYDDVQTKHFLDSLSVASVIKDFKKNLKIVDVGTGAGLPGIPLKIVFPDINLTLIESARKKARFLEQLISVLCIKDIEIVPERAEVLAHDIRYRERFDIVLSRAVAPLPTLVEFMLPFCNINGYCIAMKKGDIDNEIEQSQKVIGILGGSLTEIRTMNIEELDDKRRLIIIEKIKSTPKAYPRRPGMPWKRPIIT